MAKSIASEKILISLISIIARNLLILWCPEGDLNPHDRLRSADFKSAASANFAIRARLYIMGPIWAPAEPCRTPIPYAAEPHIPRFRRMRFHNLP